MRRTGPGRRLPPILPTLLRALVRRRCPGPGAQAVALAVALLAGAGVPVAAQGTGSRTAGVATAGAGTAGGVEPAALVADRVVLLRAGRLMAEGNVEVLQGIYRLRATRIIFDPDSDRLQIDGPIMLQVGDDLIVLADAGDLSRDLRAGIVRSARIVLDRQVQVAAEAVARSEGRYTEMRSAVASTCEICAARATPLWEIRAARVVHDQQEQLIHFERAQFRFMGVPLAWLPRLRMPAPGRDRATGLLQPRLLIDSAIGAGMRAPVFFELAPDRDLTLTPFASTRGSRALFLRYRQAFATGRIELGGALAQDRLRPDTLRGLVSAQGDFALPRDFRLQFDLILPSDDAFLGDYGVSDALRLESEVTVERVRRDDWTRLQFVGFESLRPGDDNALLPSQMVAARWERRLDVPGLGGIGTVTAEAHGHRRPSDADIAGRDQARLSLTGEWRRDAVLPAGVLGAVGAHLAIDHVHVAQDSRYPTPVTRVLPSVMAEVRWPLARSGINGTRHVIEPVAQVIWTRESDALLPDNDSLMPELDEGNLLGFDRFPGADQREQGLRANLGVRWAWYSGVGRSGQLTLGRILRIDDPGQFAPDSPVGGMRSDWLAALRMESAAGLSLSNRTLFNDDLRVTRSELQLDWQQGRYGVSTSYLHIDADPAEDRLQDAAEWSVDASVDFADHWTARLDWRYDLARSRAARAGVGLAYRNECLSMDVSLSRRFESSGSVAASTSFALSVALLGFGGQTGAGPGANCADLKG